MDDPDPADAPVTFDVVCRIQENEVPATAFGLVIATLVVEPLQIA